MEFSKKLSDVCFYADDRVPVAELNYETYISTENMLPNKEGITRSSGLPTVLQTQAFHVNDVLISNIRPYFKKIWISNRNGGCSNDVLVLRAKENCHPKFLYYLLSEDRFFNFTTITSKGTKMPRGDKRAIMQYAIPNLALDKQIEIADVLSALDDKIELNRRMNQTLEELAQTLFKKMFIDNPDRAGWEKCKLSDVTIKITKGTTPTTYGYGFSSTGVIFIKVNSITEDHSFNFDSFEFIDEYVNEALSRSKIEEDDILFTIAGTIGRIAKVTKNVLPANTNQAVAIIRSDKEKVLPNYLRLWLCQGFVKEILLSKVVQAVQANLSLSILSESEIILPNISLQKEIFSPINELINKIEANVRETQLLIELRETLLPRLMSGQVRVKNLEKG